MRKLDHVAVATLEAAAQAQGDIAQDGDVAAAQPAGLNRAACGQINQDEVGTLVDAFNDMLRELGGQAQALQLADRRKDEFLATLAHELRNPLAPLRNSVQILRIAGHDRALAERSLGVMERQLLQMVRLIDDLLADPS